MLAEVVRADLHFLPLAFIAQTTSAFLRLSRNFSVSDLQEISGRVLSSVPPPQHLELSARTGAVEAKIPTTDCSDAHHPTYMMASHVRLSCRQTGSCLAARVESKCVARQRLGLR